MLRRFLIPSKILRRNVTALYVTGDKAMENFAVLSPFLEIDKRMQNFNEIKENIERRKLPINLETLKDEYELFSAVESRKKELEDLRLDIAKQMKVDATEGLRLQGKIVREDLKKLKDNSYHLEDQFVHNFLNIPNIIHEKTPKVKEIVYSHLEKPNIENPNEKIQELIEFYDPACFYMKGDAAQFDLFTPLDLCDYLYDAGFIKFSNPDFVRSIIAEGAALNPENFFQLKEEAIDNKLNLLHLSGSGSFINYLPFISKLIAFPTQLPLKFISTGKTYSSTNHYEHQDLYATVQSTCCQAFIATSNGDSFNEVNDEMIKHLRIIYEKFNHHFQIALYPADMLGNSESFKIGIEMYSVIKEQYVEVGNFSYHGDFISKRLLFNYKLDKSIEFPHIYSGTVMNVMKVLVNLIECNKNLNNFIK